ncbi:trypsin-like serine peptidase [Nocardioides sambongensis]|uniref:trypsin-like serine peptidase n=1 Tax=Nocardioides sambongensis TaxID=2589074 RepID=UPI0011299363|nr:hypothetical protein [Nocardioides sambongensis]
MKKKVLGRPVRRTLVMASALALALTSVLVVLGGTSSQAAAPGGTGGSQAQGSFDSHVVASGRSAAKAAAAASYWTPRRMAAAVPMDETVGRPGSSRAGAAAAKKANKRVNVPRPVGKLFFSDGNVDAVCSATAVRGPGSNRVLTAGHCVHTGPNPQTGQPRFYSNWIFVPRYHKGKAPLNRWVANYAFVPKAWSRKHRYASDQAVLLMRKSNGKKLVKKVGGAKVVINAKQRQRKVRAWGWPAQGRYNGQLAWRCDGPTKKTNKYGARGDAVLSCTMNGGASGGPWLLRQRKGLVLWAVTSRRALARPHLIAHPLPKVVRAMIKARPS